jgi:hypothetical protein
MFAGQHCARIALATRLHDLPRTVELTVLLSDSRSIGRQKIDEKINGQGECTIKYTAIPRTYHC